VTIPPKEYLMQKLTLDAEMLRVQSFATDEDSAPARGTVDAHVFTTLDAGTDLDILTCAGSCPENGC
jgi:hypothetical protein